MFGCRFGDLIFCLIDLNWKQPKEKKSESEAIWGPFQSLKGGFPFPLWVRRRNAKSIAFFSLTPAEDGLRNLTRFCACKCFLTVQPGSSGPRLLALGNVEALQAPESEAGLPGERGRLPSQGWQKGREERGFSGILFPEVQSRTWKRVHTRTQNGYHRPTWRPNHDPRAVPQPEPGLKGKQGKVGELCIPREKGPFMASSVLALRDLPPMRPPECSQRQGVQQPLEVPQEAKCLHYLSPGFLMSPLPYRRPPRVRWVPGKGTGVGEGLVRNTTRLWLASASLVWALTSLGITLGLFKGLRQALPSLFFLVWRLTVCYRHHDICSVGHLLSWQIRQDSTDPCVWQQHPNAH